MGGCESSKSGRREGQKGDCDTTVATKDGSRAIQDVQLTGRMQLAGCHGM